MNAPCITPAQPCVHPVAQLLALDLQVPVYQRPYKWSEKHVLQLFQDIVAHQHKSAYRLGTVVVHEHPGKNGRIKEIVDGQQRILTLVLAVRALGLHWLPRMADTRARRQLQQLQGAMSGLTFSSQASVRNLQHNFQVICRIVQRPDFTEALVDFLLNRCQVVCFTLGDVSEAFQFFDSQNARGRDLEPHDLLKAYHLREFDPADEALKANVVGQWEACASTSLARLFAHHLYRIRRWSAGLSARQFGKQDVELFKGVNLATAAAYPFMASLRIAHHWVDHYNGQPERRIDGQHTGFPFHLDQPIINGRRFFEMVTHYQQRRTLVRSKVQLAAQGPLETLAERILDTLDSYPGRHRSGDSHVRNLFDCVLIYYIDTFGLVQISRAIETAFAWAYRLRLQQQAVRLATVDNHALSDNLLRAIQAARQPARVFAHPLSRVRPVRHEPELLALFKELNLHD